MGCCCDTILRRDLGRQSLVKLLKLTFTIANGVVLGAREAFAFGQRYFMIVPSRLLASEASTLRASDVRRVLTTLAKKRRSGMDMWRAALAQAVDVMEPRMNPSHLDTSYILHACTRAPRSLDEESTAVVKACLRRAIARVDTFSCRSLAAIATSCVRLAAEDGCIKLIGGEEGMPSIAEVFDCFAGALGKRHKPTQSKYRVKDVALLCHAFSKFPTALTIHVMFQQILREGILVTTEVDGDDESTIHVKDLAQILSACARVSVRDAEVVAACARFIPSQCKFMDAQGLAIIWQALAKLMYSETVTRVDDEGKPIDWEEGRERSVYAALQSRLGMVVHQMSWQELALVAGAASRTRAHSLCEDNNRAWMEVCKVLLHHASIRLAPLSEPDVRSLSELVHGLGLLMSVSATGMGTTLRPAQTATPEISCEVADCR
ncbi:hypothetical protein Pmar_PMAR009758 [Perkinsus marinus ATCC 50983]|uniref:Uncharacterized protein n=1 Tax=Perkinsus marinus (strain ATCC 50983 / TXsc) TaxID=423536 RepID=C5KZG4_PERM5|nr:hypothetical protein Pmar_PMAR009758 [Perkinsus marinus ATCC 50983]EER10124.1 hypothetical protein Pmar_PMAR009758 [Perkinsus marinus ATCC 50983]|eukprot:XP_002778329.1 hypothetical protein Pmar_PMAR009758 [Perkinsus marinus ATCC 50983]